MRSAPSLLKECEAPDQTHWETQLALSGGELQMFEFLRTEHGTPLGLKITNADTGVMISENEWPYAFGASIQRSGVEHIYGSRGDANGAYHVGHGTWDGITFTHVGEVYTELVPGRVVFNLAGSDSPHGARLVLEKKDVANGDVHLHALRSDDPDLNEWNSYGSPILPGLFKGCPDLLWSGSLEKFLMPYMGQNTFHGPVPQHDIRLAWLPPDFSSCHISDSWAAGFVLISSHDFEHEMTSAADPSLCVRGNTVEMVYSIGDQVQPSLGGTFKRKRALYPGTLEQLYSQFF